MLMTHSAINVVYRRVADDFEFLVHDYQSVNPDTDELSRLEVRFPTGTSGSGEFGETTEETSVRKLKEETGLDALDTEQIGKKGGEHTKYVFLIDYRECLGDLFTGPTTIGGDRMSAPYWISTKDLARRISPKHFWVYRLAVEKLRRR